MKLRYWAVFAFLLICTNVGTHFITSNNQTPIIADRDNRHDLPISTGELSIPQLSSVNTTDISRIYIGDADSGAILLIRDGGSDQILTVGRDEIITLQKAFRKQFQLTHSSCSHLIAATDRTNWLYIEVPEVSSKITISSEPFINI